MPNLTNSDFERFLDDGENDFCTERPFLVGRYSPPIVSGTSTYQLPDYILSIRRITFLGQKLDPLTKRNEREVFQSATQQGLPFWYVFNNIGALKIKLFPTPNQNLAAGTNIWSTDILSSCIIEYYRTNDDSTFVIPAWKKRQFLAAYVAKRACQTDGPSMDLKGVKFYTDLWMRNKEQFSILLDELYGLARKLVISEIVSSNYFPGEPVLPIDQFGTSVDEGY